MGSTLPEIVVEYQDMARLETEFDTDLRKGRAFAKGAGGVRERDLCALTLVHPETGQRCILRAEAVWVQVDGPGVGVGVQFDQTEEAWLSKLEAFVEQEIPAALDPPPTASWESLAARELSGLSAPANDVGADDSPTSESPHGAPELGLDEHTHRDSNAEEQSDDDDGAESSGRESSSAEQGREAQRAQNIFDRIRSLKPQEAQKVARQGQLPERVALERCFGGVVWEGLLLNPAITSAEVARIAKKGGLPKPVISLIVNNSGWLVVPEIQRALLGNPRLTGGMLPRVLRALNQTELRRIHKSTLYSVNVRSAAGKLIKTG